MSRNFWHNVWVGLFTIVAAVGVFSGQPLLVAFGVMGLAAAAISWAWNRIALEEVVYERRLDLRRVFVGETIAFDVLITNGKPLPLSWLEVTDHLDANLRVVSGDAPSNVYPNGPALRHSTSLAWYERVRWSYRVQCLRRGVYHLGPARLEAGDPFGFLRSSARQAEDDDILVYPRVVPLEKLGVPAVRPLGEVKGGIELFRDLARPSGLRDYQAGDPLKMVDWKATARSQKLAVRTFDPSSATTVILVVAVDTAEPYWAAYTPGDLERVIVASASFASYAAEQEYNLGLLANDMPVRSDRLLTVPPGRGPDQYGLVLAELATLRDYATAPMWEHLARHGRRFPLGSTLVVATAFVSGDFANVLKDLRRAGHRVVVAYVGTEPLMDLGPGIIVYNLAEHLDLPEAAIDPVAA